MKRILVDSSIWIDYFKGSKNINSKFLNECIENNLICTNDLILSELIPFLKHKKENEVIDILNCITKVQLEIQWNEIIELQTLNLKKGVNKVGIPDLIILQNVINNNLELFSIDKHFNLMNKYIDFKLIM